MKKLFLISAMVLGTMMAANAEATLELQWRNTDVAGLSGSTRQGVGHNGKMYLLNSHYGTDGQGVLEVWGANGKEKEVAPEGGFFKGMNITTDDAGNIIGRAGAFPEPFKGAGCTGVFVYNAENDEVTLFDLNDSKIMDGRNDFWGHVSGNVLSEEGGILLFGTSSTGMFNEVKIANGQHVIGGQQGIKNNYYWWSPTPAYGTCGIISSYDWMPNEAAMNEGADGATVRPIHHMIYDKSGETWVWRQDGQYCTPDRNVTTGFALFQIGDQPYLVYSRGSNNADAIVIVKAQVKRDGDAEFDENELIVYRGYAETDDAWNTIYNGTQNTAVHFNVEVAEDGQTATIYQYCPKHFVAVYTFTPEKVTTAINAVEAANAPVEYYNLQGVKVQNPTNGIFIEKRGNKAVKVVK